MKTISQSLIFKLVDERGYCGHYLNMSFNKGIDSEPSDAMVNGLYFEQEIIGKTRDGEKIEIPKNQKKGKDGTYISKREHDLNDTVKYATEIITKNNIVFDPLTVQQYIVFEDRHGHIDVSGVIGDEVVKFDLKWTGKTYDQYTRDLKYTDLASKLKIQAKQYQSLDNEKSDFIFLVFGKDWSRFFRVKYNEQDIEHHKKVATHALKIFNEIDYRPTSDSRLCFECRLRDKCKKVNEQITIEDL